MLRRSFTWMLILLTLVFIFPVNTRASAVEYNVIQAKTDVPPNKEWTVTFNESIDPSSINNDNMYVTDTLGNKINTSIKLIGGRSVIISPVVNYTSNKSYYLYITRNIKSKSGGIMGKAAIMMFLVQEDKNTTSTIAVHPEVMKRDINNLKQRVIYENGISYFNSYAFMNYTGYDDENNKTGFSDIRKMIRDDLSKAAPQLTDNNYYKNKNIPASDYVAAISGIGIPPSFPVQDAYRIRAELKDLPERLKEFYVKANIEELFKKYKPYYDAELKKYEDSTLPPLVRINNYLKLSNSGTAQCAYIQTNLLDAYQRGSTIYNPNYGRWVILTGPSLKPNTLNIVHEYLHITLNPILRQLRDEIELSSYKLKYVPENTQASMYYNNWFDIVTESMVRALDHKAVDGYDHKDIVGHMMKDGFILTEYFDKRFDEYKDYDGTLKDFIKKLLVEITPEA